MADVRVDSDPASQLAPGAAEAGSASPTLGTPAAAAPGTGGGRPPARLPSMWSQISARRVATLAAVFAVCCWGVPTLFGTFWLQVIVTMVIYAAVALGLGVLVGRAGLFSLCQIPFVAVGAWTSLRLAQAFELPFPVLLLATGVVTSLVGIVVGLPALRLSGLYLALITLMAAGAITFLIAEVKLPNGGGGFWGYDRTIATGVVSLDRPAVATGDAAYFRYCLVVVSLLFLLVTWHVRGKPGRAWAAIRQSRVTAVASGVDTTLYKLWAFALSAFITGVSGALVAAGPGGVTTGQFPVEQSIMLLAVVLMGGVYSVWGAVVAAFLLRVLPRLLDQKLGLPSDALTVLFGVGILQVLLTAPAGIIGDLEKLAKKLEAKVARSTA